MSRLSPGERLCVRDMMARNELGAPATIHSRLKSMRSKGWIALADTEDARRRQIELRPGALRHFDRLAAACCGRPRADGHPG